MTVAVGEATARRVGWHGPNVVAVGAASRGSAGRRSDIRAVPARGEAAPGRARAGDVPGQAADRERGTGPNERPPADTRRRLDVLPDRAVRRGRGHVRPRAVAHAGQIGGRSVRAFANGTDYTVRLGRTRTRTRPTTGSPSATSSGAPSGRSGLVVDSGSVKVYGDSNGSVSGAGGVNVARPPDSAGDGYDSRPGKQSWLYVRRVDATFTGPGGSATRPAIEFAFNYSKYNRETTGQDFTPQNLTLCRARLHPRAQGSAELPLERRVLAQPGGLAQPGRGGGHGRRTCTSSTRSGWAASRPRRPSRSQTCSWTRSPTTRRSAPAIRSCSRSRSRTRAWASRRTCSSGISSRRASPGRSRRRRTSRLQHLPDRLLTCDLGDLEENTLRRVVVTAPTRPNLRDLRQHRHRDRGERFGQ